MNAKIFTKVLNTIGTENQTFSRQEAVNNSNIMNGAIKKQINSNKVQGASFGTN